MLHLAKAGINIDVEATLVAIDLQDEVISSFEFYAGLADRLEKEGDQDLRVPDETLKIVMKKEPLGVCALITPWNVSSRLDSQAGPTHSVLR